MSTPTLINVSCAALVSICVLSLPSNAQSLTQPLAQAAVATDAAVNPMTGRSLNEEELARQLAKAKLQTQIGQEQVKQAQNSADWALATLRHEAEKARLRNETLALNSTGGLAGQGQKLVVKSSTQSISPAQKAIAAIDTDQSPVSLVQQKPIAQQASGSISFGSETVRVDTVARATSAQVDWVDAQTRSKQVPGAPLQPLTVQPAVGMLGIPPIPGLQPNAITSR